LPESTLGLHVAVRLYYAGAHRVRLMGLSAVISSKDERVLRILRSLLADLSIQAEFAASAAEAVERLAHQKYDAIFAECNDPEGVAVLRAVRRSQHNQRSVVFVISTDATAGGLAPDLGAHFVLEKPLVTEKVKRTLKAAHGLMMREKRAHYRHEVAAPASLRTEKAGITATLRNLSPGGAFFECTSVLKRGQAIHMRFLLPDSNVVVETAARVAWSDPTGRAGVQFESMAEESKRALMQWAAARSVEPEAPLAAVATPAAGSVAPAEAPVAGAENVEQPRAATDIAVASQTRLAIKVLGFEGGRPVIVLGSCTKLTPTGLASELQDDLNLEPSVLLQITLPGRSHPTLLHAEVCVKDGLEYSFEFVALTTFVRQWLEKNSHNSEDPTFL